jgi:LysR family transcriptional regulator, regulator for bpeEF and oprC
MDLEALSFVAQITESGNFSAAARALGLPRQLVHRRVAALERDLGVRLLDRSTRSLRLTAVGQRMRGHATRILEESRAAKASLRGVAEHPAGTLRVTTTPLFGELVLAPATQEFLSAWPDTRIEALLTMSPEPLLERDLDLAIRFGPLADSSLLAVELGQAQLIWTASPCYLKEHGTPRVLEDLRAHDLLAFSSRPGNEQFWSWLKVANGPPLIPRFSCSLETVTFDVCRAGLGIAHLPYVVCIDALKDGSLVEVLADHRPPPGSFHAVYSGKISGNPTLEAFLETIQAHLTLKPWRPPE